MSVYIFVIIAITILFGTAQYLDVYETDCDRCVIRHGRSAGALFFVGALLLTLVAGLRYGVGTDFGAYYNPARYVSELHRALREVDEPGICALYAPISRFTDDGAYCIFISAFITLALMLGTIFRHSSRLFDAAMLFVFMGCWHGSFNGVRQYLAAAILFCGYPFLKKREFGKYLVIVVIAFLFHKSAAIMLIPYFFVHSRVSVRNLILIIAGCVVVFMLYDRLYGVVDFLMKEDINWDWEYMRSAVNPIRVLVNIVPAVFYLILYSRTKKNADENFWINLLIVNAVAMLLSSRSAYLARIGIYTAPFCAIAIPELNRKLEPRYERMVMIGMLILFGIYWWYDISHSGSLNNWRWVWER